MNKQEIRKNMISRLCNNTKGYAQTILLDKNMSDKERKLEFDVIDEFVEYIRNYEENKQKIDEYNKWVDKYTDDGR